MENVKMLQQEKENKLCIILIAITNSLEIYQKKSFLSLDKKLNLDAFFISVMHIYILCYFKSQVLWVNVTIKGKKDL